MGLGSFGIRNFGGRVWMAADGKSPRMHRAARIEPDKVRFHARARCMGECPKTGIHHFEDLGFMTPCAILGGSRRLHDLFDLAAGAVDCLAEVVQYIGV
jgi:hypothetical protein